jgi:pantoate--beta-alanine ligase
METVQSVAALRRSVSAWRAQGLTVGFVPTMGALHEGHLSLIRLALARSDRVVASIFINPRQFAAHEDLGAYPRQAERDAELLSQAGCGLLFAPDRPEMYPDGFASEVTVSGVSADLESWARPHFFSGVATVVTKLLLQCLPDVAVFGEKDYQQLLVIRRLVRDLDIPVTILAGPTVREADGLALSSRNAYLSQSERQAATALSRALNRGADALARGEPIAAVEASAIGALSQAGFGPIDYVAVRGANDLAPLPGPGIDRPARILAAARLGRTRLIDNVAVTPKTGRNADNPGGL